jgi:hypothetical protein
MGNHLLQVQETRFSLLVSHDGIIKIMTRRGEIIVQDKKIYVSQNMTNSVELEGKQCS